MKEYKSDVYQNLLSSTINRYVKYGEMNKKSNDFKNGLYDDSIDLVVPLTKDETFILRCLVKINPNFDINARDICKLLNINEITFSGKVNNIFCVLRHYFNNTEGFNIEYNSTVNETNYNVTVFDGGLSQITIDILRLMNCIYLRDLTHVRMEEVKHFLSSKQYEKLLDFMYFNGFAFDEQCPDFRVKLIK